MRTQQRRESVPEIRHFVPDPRGPITSQTLKSPLTLAIVGSAIRISGVQAMRRACRERRLDAEALARQCRPFGNQAWLRSRSRPRRAYASETSGNARVAYRLSIRRGELRSTTLKCRGHTVSVIGRVLSRYRAGGSTSRGVPVGATPPAGGVEAGVGDSTSAPDAATRMPGSTGSGWRSTKASGGTVSWMD